MRRQLRTRFLVPSSLMLSFSAALLLSAAGCGGGGQGKLEEGQAPGTPAAKDGLKSLAELLKAFQDEKKKMPLRDADIEVVEPVFPAAYIGIKRGDIVYQWGASLNAAESQKVLAHEKKAETGGGWVLMQDGTIKSMKSEELKSAPKAKKG